MRTLLEVGLIIGCTALAFTWIVGMYVVLAWLGRVLEGRW